MKLCVYKYDFVVVTEKWLSSENELRPLLGFVSNQYVGIRCDRIKKKGGGILLTATKS